MPKSLESGGWQEPALLAMPRLQLGDWLLIVLTVSIVAVTAYNDLWWLTLPLSAAVLLAVLKGRI